MTKRSNARVKVSPTTMVAGGDALARDDDGRVVFVTGALPDERVVVEIIGGRRDYRRARVVEVVEPSPLRVEPPCAQVARGCGGCQWQHVSVDGQRHFKAAIVTDALRRLARITDVDVDDTVALPATGYRTTVRAAVVDGRAGYRSARSHDVIDVDRCLVAHPLIDDLIAHGHFDGADEVVLRCGARTGDRLAAPVPDHVVIDVPGDVRRDAFHEIAAGRRWQVSAESFFQSRPDGADVLADLVIDAARGVDGGRCAIDLYSGVGLFAGVLAAQGWSVTAVEGNVSAVGDARMNLRDDDALVVHADVTTWSPNGTADLVVADPSRNGLGSRGVDVVRAANPQRVVLISCDAAAFGRDAGLLRAAGYALTRATPVDLFPHTFHVEVVSVFDRR